MEKRIYVGNLPFSVTQEQLKELFSQFGEIEEATVVTNKFSGRSKGFGFVEMSNNSEAQSAIEALNEKELKGRAIKVNTARPRTENSRGRGGFGGSRKGGRQGGGRRY